MKSIPLPLWRQQ